MTDDEWRLFELARVDGRPWSEIALLYGEKTNTLQRRLARALQRVRHELGVED